MKNSKIKEIRCKLQNTDYIEKAIEAIAYDFSAGIERKSENIGTLDYMEKLIYDLLNIEEVPLTEKEIKRYLGIESFKIEDDIKSLLEKDFVEKSSCNKYLIKN